MIDWTDLIVPFWEQHAIRFRQAGPAAWIARVTLADGSTHESGAGWTIYAAGRIGVDPAAPNRFTWRPRT